MLLKVALAVAMLDDAVVQGPALYGKIRRTRLLNSGRAVKAVFAREEGCPACALSACNEALAGAVAPWSQYDLIAVHTQLVSILAFATRNIVTYLNHFHQSHDS
jgi:hypothetical protein